MTQRNVSQKMRVYHRYLGFFLSGIMAVYALSGITLIFRNSNTFKKKETVNLTVQTNLAPDQIGEALKIKKLKVAKIEGDIYQFQDGTYNKTTGEASYIKTSVPYVLDKMQHMHKATTNDPLFFLNIFFGLSLLFFVVSAFWMFIPSSSIFKKGLYFALGGVILTLIMVFI